MGKTGGHDRVIEEIVIHKLFNFYFLKYFSICRTHFDKLSVTTRAGQVQAIFREGQGVRLLLFFLFPILSFSQTNPSTAKGDDLKKQIVIDKEKFKLYNNWLSIGAGIAKNTGLEKSTGVLGIDYNFHIKTSYFQTGYSHSGVTSLIATDPVNNQIHICYGDRKETKNFNLSYFAGFSLTKGYGQINGVYENKPFVAAGLYVTAEYIQKIFYDIGIGPGVFADINSKRFIFGARLDLYLSGAYKGKKG